MLITKEEVFDTIRKVTALGMACLEDQPKCTPPGLLPQKLLTGAAGPAKGFDAIVKADIEVVMPELDEPSPAPVPDTVPEWVYTEALKVAGCDSSCRTESCAYLSESIGVILDAYYRGRAEVIAECGVYPQTGGLL